MSLSLVRLNCSMDKPTIIVTGGAGFIGSNFILDWINQNKGRVINVDVLTYAGNLENLQSIKDNKDYIFIRSDIGDSKIIEGVFSIYKPTAVINFAAESHVDRSISSPKSFIDTNIVGTFNLLECTKFYWNSLSEEKKSEFRFLHVSTDEVYGSLSLEDPAFTEDNKYAPNSPYSASKAASDHLVRSYYHTYGLPVLTTNCSNNYGSYQFPEKLIPLIIHNALSLKPLPIYGKGDQVRDWLYVKDHCSAICSVLEKGKLGEVYNIGGNNEMKNIDVVRTICSILDDIQPRQDGDKYESLITFVKDRPGHDKRYAIDASKILNELGWKPSETFDTGIRKTIQWYIDNQKWILNITNGSYKEWIKNQYS